MATTSNIITFTKIKTLKTVKKRKTKNDTTILNLLKTLYSPNSRVKKFKTYNFSCRL